MLRKKLIKAFRSFCFFVLFFNDDFGRLITINLTIHEISSLLLLFRVGRANDKKKHVTTDGAYCR